MKIGCPKEIFPETRVALSPEVAAKFAKLDFDVIVESNAGLSSGFQDQDYKTNSRVSVGSHAEALSSNIVFQVNRPTDYDLLQIRPGSVLVGLLKPYLQNGFFEKLAELKITGIAMELIPRTSRAQSMDALSSQANIAGYRAVVEAAHHFGRFFPMMMTAAGSAKPARVAVLGVGVAGLQAISTAKRLGAVVEAYDVRPEVREQIISVGAKFIEVDIGESGVGTGGYAKELSLEAKKRQQDILAEKLKKFDIIITTANVPGRTAPTLVNEEVVKAMRTGSVIVDMAAASGGNCPLTIADQVVVKNGVSIIGHTNLATLQATDATSFYAKNLWNLANLFWADGGNFKINLEDDIIDSATVVHDGIIRKKDPK